MLNGDTDEIHPFVAGYFRSSQRMIRTARWKLIDYPLVGRRQLFDLQEDPDERVNLIDYDQHQQVANRLETQLEKWLANRK